VDVSSWSIVCPVAKLFQKGRNCISPKKKEINVDEVLSQTM